MNNKYKVYIHTNLKNNKKYVGITSQRCNERWRKDGAGYQNQPKFFNAIIKYGWDNFKHEIIYENLSAKEASKKEQELIQLYDTYNNGYNADLGGLAPKHSEETKNKIRQSMYGHFHTEETKKKISKSKKQDWISVKCIETNIIYESIIQAEKETLIDSSSIVRCCTGQQLTAGGYTWEYTDLTLKQKYDKIKQEKVDKRKRKVYCITNDKKYDSVAEAARDTNSDASNIIKVCNGKYKSTNNLKWRWDYE